MSAATASLRRVTLSGTFAFHQRSKVSGVRQVPGSCRCLATRAGSKNVLTLGTPTRQHQLTRRPRSVVVRAAETETETKSSTQELPPSQSDVEGKEAGAKAQEEKKVPEKPKAPTLKKGMVVRVDKEKYYNSVEALATNHPQNYAGLDYIFEDRGEILDVRIFEAGEYALVAWSGILTAPAWLPAYMLHKVEKNTYKRIYGP